MTEILLKGCKSQVSVHPSHYDISQRHSISTLMPRLVTVRTDQQIEYSFFFTHASRPVLVCLTWMRHPGYILQKKLWPNNKNIFLSTTDTLSSGPCCSKLTTSLKFQTLISKLCQYCLLKKCEKLLNCKSFSRFINKNYRYIWY